MLLPGHGNQNPRRVVRVSLSVLVLYRNLTYRRYLLGQDENYPTPNLNAKNPSDSVNDVDVQGDHYKWATLATHA